MSLLPSSSVENIKCFLRCKPLSKNELDLSAKCIQISKDKRTILVDMSTENKIEKCFSLDYIFEDNILQEEIFEKLAKPLLSSFIQGYNCTIFAYGQTGAGKTHTILGPFDTLYDESNQSHGLIPRILSYLFNQESIASVLNNQSQSSNKKEVSYSIKCSCLEIYQEHLIDLLKRDDNEEAQLIIRENSDKGIYIENLTKIDIINNQQAKDLLMTGMKNRHVARTNMNASSSRSHLIFTIFLESSVDDGSGNGISITRTSRLHLIDLAGSERQKATQAMGERIKEAGNINKSLSILGNVINALIEQTNSTKSKFVPFRDSKLTHFLKDSLGGNSKTIIIANISQSVILLQETISTLKFVQRAKMITNKTIVNENINNPKKISYLENEIKRLKGIINSLLIVQKDKEDISKSEENIGINYKNKNQDNRKTEIYKLLNKINEFIGYEESIFKKFKFLDIIGMDNINQFYYQKEKYEKEIEAIIHSSNNYNSNDIINIMKQELNIYKYLSQFYQYKNQIKETQGLFSNDFIEKYISLHNSLKEFLSNSFKVSSEIMITDKNQFKQKNFQLEELAIANEENLKMTENLKSEIFLLRMELCQYKNENETENNINNGNNNGNENNSHIMNNLITEFSFTPTKSPISTIIDNNIDNKDNNANNSNNKQFISNLRKSLMKSNTSIKPNTDKNNNNYNNEALIIKENLDNALKAIKENDKLISALHQHNSSIEYENCQLKNELNALKEDLDTINSINLIYKNDIIRLNAQLSSIQLSITDAINEISLLLSSSNNKLNTLSAMNDDFIGQLIKCVNCKAKDNEMEMIQYEKAILDLKIQRKQLMEEIKLLNDEFDSTLTSQEKCNAKIRIYNRIKDKSEFKREYDDLVNFIFELFPLKNNSNDNNKENSHMIDNRRNNKNAIDRLRKAAESIEMLSYYKTNYSHSNSNSNFTTSKYNERKNKRSIIIIDKSKSPVGRKK